MRPRPNFSAAARATARWPRCTGSKVPPKRAIFMRLSALPQLEGPLLGDALHALRLLLILASRDRSLSCRRMLLRVSAGANLGHHLPERILQFGNALTGDRRELVQLE